MTGPGGLNKSENGVVAAEVRPDWLSVARETLGVDGCIHPLAHQGFRAVIGEAADGLCASRRGVVAGGFGQSWQEAAE